MSILQGELAQIIGEALIDADVPYPVTLTRTSPGEIDPDAPWLPVEPVTEEIEVLGFADTYSQMYVAQGIVQADDLKVVIIGTTLGEFVPKIGDAVTVRGQTYTVLNVSPDPALATYELQAR